MTERKACLHCRVAPSCRPRGLFSKCFDAPGVRGQYPSRVFQPELPTCRLCGNQYGATGRDVAIGKTACGTCKLAEPLRSELHRRIALYERRAALGLPLFEPTTEVSAA